MEITQPAEVVAFNGFFSIEEIKIKPPEKRSLSEEQKRDLINLYANGYSYNEIGKIMHLKRAQVGGFINSNKIQEQVTPALLPQMIERIREMWLKGWLPQTISEKLGYNYHLCTEFVLMYTEELDRQPHVRGIANSWVVRINKMRSMGAVPSEIAYRLKIPMFWVKRILE